MPLPYDIDAAGNDWVQKAAGLAKDVLAKHAADVDAKGRFPAESMKALADAGFYGLCLPANLGGKGQGPHVFAAVVEELAMQCASTAMVFMQHTLGSQTIVQSPTLKGRDDLVKQICAGKHLVAVALSEKGARSLFWMPLSRLEPKGSDYTVNAQKVFVTGANHADSFVSIALKPGATQPATPGDSVLYLAKKGAGIRATQDFDAIGLRGNDSNAVTFENVTVTEGDLICKLGEGVGTVLGPSHAPWFMIGTAAVAHGLCRAVVGATIGHLTSSKFDNANMRLCDIQLLRTRLGEMHMRTEQSRAMLAFTFREMFAGSEATALYLLEARMSAIEAALEVTDLAMKTCGGSALLRGKQIERSFRDARAGWVMSPTTDLLQDLVGKALTGLPLL